jgi:tRNA wybutosine-synthesizing protein 1
MDLGDGPIWPLILADRIDQLISLWHTYRVGLCATIVTVVVLLVWRARTRKLPTRVSNLPPASEEKASWLEEQHNRDEEKQLSKDQERHSLALGQPKPSLERSHFAGPKIIAGQKPARAARKTNVTTDAAVPKIQPLVFFSSLTGTTEKLSSAFTESLKHLSSDSEHILPPRLHDLSYIDLDDYFITGPKISSSLPSLGLRYFYCLLIPSYDIDTIINTFVAHLDETHNDFRIDTAPLATLLGYSVFGIGDRQGWPTEEAGFCSQAIEVDRWMAKLTGRKRAYPLGLGDVKSNIESSLREWTAGVTDALKDVSARGSLGEGVPGSGDAVESDEEDEADTDFPDSSRRKRQKTSLADLEDVGGSNAAAQSRAPLAIDFTTSSMKMAQPAPLKEMVPAASPTYTALTKQGYTIIGSHSGVKICRWTKSALRGRGSCYKNSFYGIKSHLCMETTPSLSCSNKCVFCWRHGTNPVSTTWRWQVDDPEMIFKGAKEGHYKKIKMMRGVPGVRAERFEEAMKIRHCALSLVGEPIFYPRINEFVGLLHGDRISSFLVCNAQHPDQLRSLRRVTQLYVSIDASNKDSLRKIDRPLHRDFWERFQNCLDILRDKRFVQRTVFRLTLVKGFNVEDEVEGYADLVQKGLPCFVEIKGVTYCGTSSSAGAGLTMQNVPFYEEVVTFVEALDAALGRRGLEYGIAAEHAHSCCILLASKRFLIDERWNTIIDYDQFFRLLEAGEEFGPEDYCSPTPEWALWGNGGFDPADQRVDRKGKPKVMAVNGVEAVTESARTVQAELGV